MNKRMKELVTLMADKMRDDAETGLPDSVMRQINFRAIAISAYLAIQSELKDSQ